MTTDEKKNEERQVSRRQLFKTGVGLIGAGLAIGEASASALDLTATAPATNESVIGMKFEPRDTVRLGVIGVGGRGTGMLLKFPGASARPRKRDLRLSQRTRHASAGNGREK